MWNRHSNIEVRTSALGRAVFATAPIAAGESVIELARVFEEAPGSHTIQVGERRHQAFTGEIDDFVNHSCDPTCRVDVSALTMSTIADIAVGQELTFNYLTTEWDMIQPFRCECDGEPRLIRGFRHLSPEEQARLTPLVAPWLLQRVPTCSGSVQTEFTRLRW